VIGTRAAELDVDYAEARRRMFTDETALGGLVDATDTARTVLFLASDLGRHITAQDINVDGGTVWY
jgi:NAD(P)-dependent dehydrogenase (short-subunit alcohol dehydrogenase family)